jgi:methionyl-tRNA formyltransferase
MRVVFLGNHTVGVRVLQAISKSAEVAGVVAHPPDPEDGLRYESVSGFAEGNGWKLIRGKGRSPEVHAFIMQAKPDLLWITDFRYLIPAEMIALAPLGAVNLHPSLLPAYRGRAPVNWAILNGDTRLGLTAHFVDEGMDTGDIIEQVSYEICDDQDVGDCLNILYPLYGSITQKVLAYFESGRVPRVPQDHSRATTFPRRRPEDGRIDWTQTARSIYNLVRAVASPYPGAFTTLGREGVTVWKARIASDIGSTSEPGRVIADHELGPLVQCGQGTLLLTRFEAHPSNSALKAGCQLGA